MPNKQRLFKTFILLHLKELTGMHIELNDIQSILMNEFILQAWKREKYRRERHI